MGEIKKPTHLVSEVFCVCEYRLNRVFFLDKYTLAFYMVQQQILCRILYYGLKARLDKLFIFR